MYSFYVQDSSAIKWILLKKPLKKFFYFKFKLLKKLDTSCGLGVSGISTKILKAAHAELAPSNYKKVTNETNCNLNV
jgi:hypothetical protein